MQVTKAVGTKLTDLFVDLLDGGSIIFHDAADTLIATLTLNTPAFGGAVAGVATMNVSPAPKDSWVVGGTVDHSHFCDNSGTIQSRSTCGTSGTEFIFSSLSFDNGNELEISALEVSWNAADLA